MGIQLRSALSIIALIALLAAIGIATAVSQSRVIESRVDGHTLETGHSIQLQVERAMRRELELTSSVVAGSPSFVGYIAQSLSGAGTAGQQIDTASIRDLLDERRVEFGLDLAGVLNVDGRTVAVTGDVVRGQPDFSSTPLVQSVRDNGAASIDLWTYDNRLLLVSVTPMLRGATVEAMLLSGYEISAEFAARIARTAQTGITLVGVAANATAIIASTLPGNEHPRVVALIDSQSARLGEIAAQTALPRLDLALDSGSTRATVAPLFGAPQTALLVSSISVEQRLAIDDGIRQPMLIGAAVGVVLLLLFGLILQRRVMKPLADLSDLSDRILRGDFQLFAKTAGSAATARIGAAFNHVLGELRGYKEAIEQRRDRG